ncbi:MAG: hypothetical protein KAI43_12990 [Candidatus Aureabacteria bacterium]|nr:hypothetical protein [Candidatus Auribacterota bacterium]
MKKNIVVLIVLFVMILSVVNSLYSQDAGLKKALEKVTKEKCVYGLFMHNLPIRIHRINKFDLKIGKKPGMIMFFMNWEKPFPRKDMESIINYSAIPHIVWEPTAYKGGKENIYLKNIIEGEWDEYLKRWAKAAKEFNYPFILRLGHEMDGNWYSWSGAKNNNEPHQYVKMWRHVHDIFDEAGAKNVIWAWTPMNTNVIHEEWNEFYHYYPGDEYVDWVGMDGYNWGNTQNWSRWSSFVDLFNSRYYEMVQRYPEKPMMIGEFATATKGGSKKKWIEETLSEIKNNYPAVKSFVWFNINKECDWRIHSDEESVKSFSKNISDDYFLSDVELIRHYFKEIKFPDEAVKGLTRIEVAKLDNRPSTIILWTSDKSPLIDGDIKDWPKSGFIELGKNNIIMETEAWNGKKDLSAKASLMLSQEYLFFTFDVTDDVIFVNAKEKKDIWNGDSVEIAFNFNSDADPERDAMSSDDFQVGVVIKKEDAYAWSWQLGRIINEAEVIVKPTEMGYIVEAKIPLSVFSLQAFPKPGTKVMINFVLNDADKENREIQMLWSGDSLFYKDPSVWGFANIEFMP